MIVASRSTGPRSRIRLTSVLLGLGAILSLLFTPQALADLPTGVDQAGWDRTAAIARAWLAADAAGQRSPTLDQWEDLRITLTVERELALEKGQRGSIDTRILQAQLAELGTPPANGVREASWIASRREQLNAVLAKAELPLLAASEAHARAGVLIADVNGVIDRKTRAQLLERVDTVLGPGFWQALFRDLKFSSASPGGVIQPGPAAAAWNAPYVYASIVLGIIAVLAAIFTHRWIFALERRRKPSPRGHLGFALLEDFADIALPMLVILLALTLLDGAASRLAIPPGLETAIITAGAIAIYLHWLGRSVFLPRFEPGRVIDLPQVAARRAVLFATILGFVLAAESLVEYAEDLHAVPVTLLTLASLAVTIGASICVWLLTRTVSAARPAADRAVTALGSATTPMDLTWPLSRLLAVAAIVAPLLALAGYVVLAREFLISSIYSVAAICVALFLFRSITRASDILFDRLAFRKSPSWQFVPLVFGFFLVLLTLPIIAMLWGVSFATILVGVIALKEGVQVGQVHVSFGNVFAFGLVFMLGYLLTRWLQRVVQIALFPRLELDVGGKAAVLTAVGYAGLTLSALVAITAAGLNLASLAVVAGALSVGVGFGLQSIVSNFVSGLILLVERPIKEGDFIEVGTIAGHVRRIAFRSTHIETFDHHEVIIPNSELISGSVTNLTYGGSEGRISLPVGIAYDANVGKATAALLAAARAHPKVLPTPAPSVSMNGFGESALDLTLYCFVEHVNYRVSVRSDLYVAVLKAFQDQGIGIPFPQRDVRIRQG